MRQRHGGTRGASLVEFALVLPILGALLLGIVTGGFALATKNSMTNAVREASRLGATLPEGAGWDPWASAVKDRAVEVAGDDLEADEICVQMVSVGAGGDTVEGQWPAAGCTLSAAAPSTPANVAVGTCVVKVWARGKAELNALVFTQSLTLDADAVSLYERTDCP